jgi:hypothetical protein
MFTYVGLFRLAPIARENLDRRTSRLFWKTLV